ncbi:Bone morphogenetic protein 1, partial [Desmophyllum pertusum]
MHFQHLVICISAAEPGNITEWEGSLTSPNYPLTYPANSSLTWIKSVSPGNRVKITIIYLRTECDADYLEIRDGVNMASPLIARYCGSYGFTEITPSGTHVLLHFVSDNVTDVSQRGFVLRHS